MGKVTSWKLQSWISHGVNVYVTGMDNHIIQLFNGLNRSDLGQPCLSQTGFHWIPLMDLRSDHGQPPFSPTGIHWVPFDFILVDYMVKSSIIYNDHLSMQYSGHQTDNNNKLDMFSFNNLVILIVTCNLNTVTISWKEMRVMCHINSYWSIDVDFTQLPWQY